LINSQGYLIDADGNVVDKDDGTKLFEKKHLLNDEIPKLFAFIRFNIKDYQGDYEKDKYSDPILKKDKNGEYVDKIGRKINSKGYLIDKKGNVIDQNGYVMFNKEILDSDDDIPIVFRSGLLMSDEPGR